jgi:hypothetical protein
MAIVAHEHAPASRVAWSLVRRLNPTVDPGRAPRAAALAVAGVVIGLASAGGPGRRLDVRLFRTMNAARGSVTDRSFSAITELGSIFGSTGAAAALSIAGHRRAAARGLGAACTMWVAGQILKRAFLRARPYDEFPRATRRLIGRPHGMSWPSSHPAVLLTFLTVVERELGLRPPLRKGLGGLAAGVGISRVYLGVHYPSDVAGGLLLGRALGLAWPGETDDPSVE